MTKQFKRFPKIKQYRAAYYTITEKLHGTNASIHIYVRYEKSEIEPNEVDFAVPYEGYTVIVRPGKRSGYVSLKDDNFGFAKFVHERKEELAKALGQGRFFGEFVGPGINSDYGLEERRLILFDPQRSGIELLPDRVDTVPVLKEGRDLENLDEDVKECMDYLKAEGSAYSKGFPTPEGVVISIFGDQNQLIRFKDTFEQEEVAWAGVKKKKVKNPRPSMPDVGHLLQPIRLEKLLSSDENLLKGVPKNLGEIAKLYIADLIAENQVSEEEELLLKAVKKKVFGFIVAILKEKGYM